MASVSILDQRISQLSDENRKTRRTVTLQKDIKQLVAAKNALDAQLEDAVCYCHNDRARIQNRLLKLREIGALKEEIRQWHEALLTIARDLEGRFIELSGPLVTGVIQKEDQRCLAFVEDVKRQKEEQTQNVNDLFDRVDVIFEFGEENLESRKQMEAILEPPFDVWTVRMNRLLEAFYYTRTPPPPSPESHNPIQAE